MQRALVFDVNETLLDPAGVQPDITGADLLEVAERIVARERGR